MPMGKDAPVLGIALYGGLGLRFGEEIPKQFFLLDGKPLLSKVLDAFEESSSIDKVFVVSHKDHRQKMKEAIKANGYQKPLELIDGGATRFDSVYRALKAIKEEGYPDEAIVVIQDGCRVNLDQDLLQRSIQDAKAYGASVTAIPSKDTCFLSEDGENMTQTLPRKKVFRAQTPQSFRFGLIYHAYLEAGKHPNIEFTDDASVASHDNIKVHILLGSEDNLKITEKEDLERYRERRRL